MESGQAGGVVITGASTGIGRAAALRLDGLGLRVFAGVRREEDAASLRAEASDRLMPIRLDVTKIDEIDAAAVAVDEALGDAPLLGLVNNAGIGIGGPLEFIDLDELRWQFEVNVVGQVATAQAFIPQLRSSEGRIVNVGSIGGRVATPLTGPYCASKFALEAITDAWRAELAPWNVFVCIVDPGQVVTPIWDKAKAKASELESKMTARQVELYREPIERLKARFENAKDVGVTPEKVAAAIEHALTASRPKIRYYVGPEAKAAAALRWLLPDRPFDAVIRRFNR